MENRTIYSYTLLRKLGTGGMAEVWYAENKLGKRAAVKILSKKLSDDENIKVRFESEARVMVKLNHPNIRQVYDYGMIEERPCIIMEYLDGEDLGTLIKKGGEFSQEQIVRWWNQMSSALNYTHGQGIVHRDIKPSNIFITNEGNVELLDFGIAKVADNYLSTLSGMSMGTPMYMSPEQVISSKHIDYRSDVYSLAVTFVHLLGRKAPYSSDMSVYSLHKSIVEEPLDLSGIPLEWREFLSPYLAKQPEARPKLKKYRATATDTTQTSEPKNVSKKKSTSKPKTNVEPKATSKQETTNETVVDNIGINIDGKTTINEDSRWYKSGEVTNVIIRWNWGAFFFSWFWGVCNGVYWPLWLIIINVILNFIDIAVLSGTFYGNYYAGLPSTILGGVISFCARIALGMNGSKWAWTAKTWSSIAEFKRIQHKWAIASFWIIAILVGLGILFLIYLFY